MWSKSRPTLMRYKRFLSSQVTAADTIQPSFRTSAESPLEHTQSYCGQFYTMNPSVRKNLFTHGGLPMSFVKQTKTFTETCIMVREPALQVIDCINRSDFNKPVNRFVLYGDKGTGKSLTLAHLLHYAYESGFLIVHVPWVPEWLRRTTTKKEISNSATRDGFVDLPLDAAAWLIHFKLQNHKLLKDLDLKVTKEYTWSKRESTQIGSSIVELIDLGVNRVKYASDVVVALIDELKILSTQKMCKTFVAIDGFNCFFYPLTRLKTDIKKKVSPKDVTLTIAFLELTKNDWSNGATVVVVDKVAVPDDHQESHYPRYLLGKEGFEHLDPFVPVEVKNYTDKEFISCTAYYRDRLWLRDGPMAEQELSFNSAKNPYNLMELCAPL